MGADAGRHGLVGGRHSTSGKEDACTARASCSSSWQASRRTSKTMRVPAAHLYTVVAQLLINGHHQPVGQGGDALHALQEGHQQRGRGALGAERVAAAGTCSRQRPYASMQQHACDIQAGQHRLQKSMNRVPSFLLPGAVWYRPPFRRTSSHMTSELSSTRLWLLMAIITSPCGATRCRISSSALRGLPVLRRVFTAATAPPPPLPPPPSSILRERIASTAPGSSAASWLARYSFSLTITPRQTPTSKAAAGGEGEGTRWGSGGRRRQAGAAAGRDGKRQRSRRLQKSLCYIRSTAQAARSPVSAAERDFTAESFCFPVLSSSVAILMVWPTRTAACSRGWKAAGQRDAQAPQVLSKQTGCCQPQDA